MTHKGKQAPYRCNLAPPLQQWLIVDIGLLELGFEVRIRRPGQSLLVYFEREMLFTEIGPVKVFGFDNGDDG